MRPLIQPLKNGRLERCFDCDDWLVVIGGELESTGLLNRTLHVVVGQLAT